MKTALVHDFLAQAGGAERVVAELHNIFPDAPLYTSVYDPKSTFSCFSEMDVRTSFMQKLPIATGKLHKLGLPLYPSAFEQFDLSAYELVLSSSSSFAKGVITDPRTCHVCYCHTPARFAWRPFEYHARQSERRWFQPALEAVVQKLRAWDLQSAHRVDYFIANSVNVARRISKYYRRNVAAVVYPPIDVNRFEPAPPKEVGNHFLIVSRLINYKRVDLAIQACNELKAPLRVVGTGPELANLRKIAGPTIQFAGKLSDREVTAEYARCKALIFPGEEDFGMTPLEAMASGRPVVAYGAGGALETNVDGETGVLFYQQNVRSLVGALNTVSQLPIVPAMLRAHAEQFDTTVFQARMKSVVEAVLEDHRRAYASAYLDKFNHNFTPTQIELRAAANRP